MKNTFYFILATFFSWSQFVFAQTQNEESGGTGNSGSGGTRNDGTIQVSLENPLKFDSLNDFLVAIINVVMVLMIPVIVFFIIYAGFKYVTARGNATQIEEATKTLTYAIIGAILILGAIVISQVIKGTVDSFIAP